MFTTIFVPVSWDFVSFLKPSFFFFNASLDIGFTFSVVKLKFCEGNGRNEGKNYEKYLKREAAMASWKKQISIKKNNRKAREQWQM